MACSSLSYPECGVARPSPVSSIFNEPCVKQCPDSQVLIGPSPVAVTIPGPIMSTFPQHSEAEAVRAPLVGSSYGGSLCAGGLFSSGAGYGGLSGLGGSGGYGGLLGYGGLCGYGGRSGYGGGNGTGVFCHRYLSASGSPC